MEEYKEELTIPIYKQDFKLLCAPFVVERYKTEPYTFPYKNIWAICTKDSYQTGISRGGALIFTKQRPTPYITDDEYSVKRIIKELDSNPLACLSGLVPFGANQRLYAKLQDIVDGCYVMEYPDQTIKLHLTDEAIRNQRRINYVLTKGPKKTCALLTKKMVRERNKKKT